jgi:hypothetical protein
MNRTHLRNQKTIKVMPSDQAAVIPAGVISSDHLALPPNCYIVPMVVLDKPIPIPKGRKKKQ